MRKRLSELKAFHWRLWIALCALALIPALYQTIQTFLISSGTKVAFGVQVSSSVQAGAFDIIGQMEWFDLINETLQAFLIVPLYSVLNRIFQNNLNFKFKI